MSRYSVVFGEQIISDGRVEFIETPEAFSIESLRLTDPTLKTALRSLEVGDFVLDQAQFSDMETETSFVQAGVYEVDGFENGRHKNSHGLLFGQLVLSSMFDRQKQVFAAVKPFDTAKDAIHEFAAINYVNGFGEARGALLAFNTLGFHRFTETGQYGLITAYDETVISYDNIFWDPEAQPSQQEVAKALSRCAFTLARLHVFGLSHGDAQVKNMASDNKRSRFTDLESARPFAVTQSGDVDVLSAKHEVMRDISTFVSSLQTGIEDPELIDSTRFQEPLIKAFNEHYLPTVRHPSSRLPKGARPTLEEIKDAILLAA